jgi:hypothetical protein
MIKKIIFTYCLMCSCMVKAQSSSIVIDTFYNTNCKRELKSNLNLLLSQMDNIRNSQFIEDRVAYVKGTLKDFDIDLKTNIFSKLSVSISAFIERYSTDNDYDYLGIFELHFQNDKDSKMAFEKLYKYDNNFGSSIIYHDWFFFKVSNIIYIIESLPKTKNYVLKDEIISIIKEKLIVSEFKQRR